MMLSSASLWRRFGAGLYELLILVAIWMVCGLVFILLMGTELTALKRLLLQVSLWLVAGAYFSWCWCKSGQTLAMQTWHIRLLNHQGQHLSLAQAWLRYVLASTFLVAFGVGFVWALVDKEHQFLHDRLLGTRLVRVD